MFVVSSEMYAHKDKEGVPATFQILSFIGWKPDPSQVSSLISENIVTISLAI